jgi:WD40 repeat protein
VSFSPDSKYVIAQGGSPDWTLVYWGWEKAKLMATIKTTNQQDSPIHQVSFNPRDNTSICVIGEGIYKQFRYTEGNLKQHSFQKSEPLNYCSHAWISDTHLLLGTDNGKIQLFEGGELKNDFDVIVSPDTSRSPSQAETKDSSSATDPTIVHSIVTYSKGFICSGGSGVLHLFEKTDEKNVFKKVRSIHIWTDSTTQPDIPESSSNTVHEILNMALSPSEENVVCTTHTKQLYSLPLSAADLGKVGGRSAFDYLVQSFHSSHITGMDVCLRKPIIGTCSLDRTVRIWNYETLSLEVWKEFQEEAHSIAVHPSGLFVLVGFSEKLRLMNILIDDIRVFKEISIRGCRECRFSHGGHLLAAANSNLIQIYGTYTFENVGNLKGHSGKVRSIQWNHDDTRLVTCSMDGAVYDWSLQAYQRENDCVVKNCSYTSVSITADMKATYAVGSDCTLKEINLAESSVTRELPTGQVALTQVCLSHSGRMMFVGTSTGVIRAVKYPLGETGEWQEYQAHSGPVSKLCLSYDDQYMFSVGEDGSMFVFKVTEKDGRGIKRDREIVYSEEILITKSDLEEKNTLMSELNTRVDELRMENEYQLRLKDMNHNEKVKEMSDNYQKEMEAVRGKLMALQLEKEQLEAKHDDEVQGIKEKHIQEVHDLGKSVPNSCVYTHDVCS